jgi:hypothetical protein
MQRSLKLFAITALLGYFVGPRIPCVMAQAGPTVADLLRQLGSSRTSAQAEKQLLKLGSSNAEARRYLSRNLPALIEADPKDPRPQKRTVMRPEWLYVVQVAGLLKIVEAAPALAKWIDYPPSPAVLDEESVPERPAALALVQIGDPAIPTLQNVLAHGDTDERWQAAQVLDSIGSPKATAVLGQYAATGQDHALADFIKRVMAR